MKEIIIGLLFLLGGMQLSTAQSSIQCIAENQYNLSVPTIPEYDFGHGDFTLEAFIQVGSITGTSENPTILAHRQNKYEPGFTFFIYRDSLGLGRSGVLLSGVYYTSAFGPDIMDNRCHQIAVTRRQDIISFYVDGQLVSTGQVSLDNVYSPRPLRMGRFGYDGTLDEVRIWNVARTEQEQQDYLTTPLLGTETGLVGYWKMDEGSGQIIADSSPLANHGVLGGSENDFLNDPEWTTSECHPRVEYDLDITENDDTMNVCGDDSLWINVRNLGAKTIPSLSLVYSVDGVIVDTLFYAETINPNETATVLFLSSLENILPNFLNELTIQANLINEIDNDPINNTKNMVLYRGEQDVSVSILTDYYPEEISFDITNDVSGEVVYRQEEGAFTAIHTQYNFFTCLPVGCYTFTVYDTYGDGVCCGWGDGYYELAIGGSIFESGGAFTDYESNKFCIHDTHTAIQEIEAQTMQVYPIPTSAYVYIAEKTKDNSPKNIQVIDLQGRVVWHSENVLLQPFYSMDLSTIQSGAYMLEITDTKTLVRFVKKISIVK